MKYWSQVLQSIIVAVVAIGIGCAPPASTPETAQPTMEEPTEAEAMPATTSKTVESDLVWIADEAQGLEVGRRDGRPVMLNFYATWSAACNELEHTYADPVVKSKLSKFVNVKLNFTRPSDEFERLKRKYGIVGLPVVIFFDSDGNQLTDKRLEKFVEPEEFLTLLEGIN